MIDLDGAHGSGGGAVLRVASALAAVTGEEIHITNIRKGRPTPGLKTQHLEGLKAVAALCDGRLEGAELGSEEISFFPGKIKYGSLDIKPSTAASTGLIFQTLKLPASQAGGEVKITISGGATFGKWAPPLLTSQSILLPALGKMGYKANIRIERHGFFPAGGARTEVTISPCKEFNPLDLTALGKITHMGGISVASEHLQKARVAERQARAAERFLRENGLSPLIKEMYVKADCPGSGVVLWASDGKVILGGDCIGERWKKAEDVGMEAAQSLYKSIQSGATVDEKLSDQLLIFMAFAKGKSRIVAPRLTNHTKTNIWVIQQFLDVEFRTEDRGGNVLIECSGIRN
ncbi:MAG: RNA 3'-terminal phosphate cyclase [Candidatus Aenigmarchaeota archaeon]|nr:RNA 3'-terminal phosphate cyclase [Candidatus Aenigmarchaeota archaeon]